MQPHLFQFQTVKLPHRLQLRTSAYITCHSRSLFRQSAILPACHCQNLESGIQILFVAHWIQILHHPAHCLQAKYRTVLVLDTVDSKRTPVACRKYPDSQKN